MQKPMETRFSVVDDLIKKQREKLRRPSIDQSKRIYGSSPYGSILCKIIINALKN